MKTGSWLRQNMGKISLGFSLIFLLTLLTLPSLSFAQGENDSYFYWAQPTCVYPVVAISKEDRKVTQWFIDYNWSVCNLPTFNHLNPRPNTRLAFLGNKKDDLSNLPKDNPPPQIINYLVSDQPLRFAVPGGYLDGYLVFFAFVGKFEPRGAHEPASNMGFYVNVAIVPKDAIGRMVVKPTPTPRPLAQGQAPLPNQQELPPGFNWVVADVLDMFPPKKTWVWVAEVAKKIAQQTNRPYEDVLSEIQLINGNGYIPGSFGGYVVGKMTKIVVKSQDVPWPQAPQPRPYTEGDIYDVYASIKIQDEVPQYIYICQDNCGKGKTWDGYRYVWPDNPPKIHSLTEMDKAFVQYVHDNLTFRYWNGETMSIPLTEELLQIGFSIQETSGYPWEAWLGVLWTESPKFVDATSYAGAQGLNQMLPSTFKLFTHKPKADIWNHWDNSFSAANDQVDLGLGAISKDLWVCRFATTGCGSPRVWNFHRQQAGNAWDFAMFMDGEWQKFQNDWYAGRRG